RREEITALPEDSITVIATGPLTSAGLAEEIARVTGSGRLFFYDSISPIVEADSVNYQTAFWASRYGKSTDETDDYLNCPLVGEQARVLRLIPGLENAEFLRFGQIHRNTYINAPALLTPSLQLRTRPEVLFAGQISGVEGYVESIATGLMAGMHAAALASGAAP